MSGEKQGSREKFIVTKQLEVHTVTVRDSRTHNLSESFFDFPCSTWFFNFR